MADPNDPETPPPAPEPLEPSAPPPPLAPPAPPARRRVIGAGDFDTAFADGRGLDERLYPTVAYLLMLLGVLSFGLSSALGAFIAWSRAKTAPQWLRTHYLFQVRTFCVVAALMAVAVVNFLFLDRGVISAVVGAPLSLALLLGMVWLVARSAVGLGRLWRGEALHNYRTWMV